MNNLEELKQIIQNIDETIQKENDFNASTYAFYQQYDNKTDTIGFPSFALHFKTYVIKNYCHFLLHSAILTVDKSSEIRNFDYSNTKKTIDYLNLKEPNEFGNKIKNCINLISNSKTENFKQVRNKCNCLAIQISEQKLGNIFFFMKATLFVKQQKFLFLLDDKDNVSEAHYNLKLPLSLAALIIKDDIFLLNNEMDTIFGFENSLKIKKEESIQNIKNTNILNEESFELFNKYCSKGKTYYKFSNFDSSKLIALQNGSANKILDNFKIPRNKQGKIVLETEDQAKILCKFICNDIKSDCIDPNLFYNSPGNTVIS